MGEKWQRSTSVPFPQIWRRCTGRQPMADGTMPKFRIQDVPEDRFEDIVQFMSTYFVKDETLSLSTKLWLDNTSMQELQDLWRDILKRKVSVVAFVEESGSKPRIAGCNVLGVVDKNDTGKKKEVHGVALKKFVDALDYPGSQVDMFERYGVDEYIVGMGLSISPEYRGQGLGLELIRARYDLGRAVGLKLTATLFTAIQSQVLAAKVGMDVVLDIPYKDYKVNGEVVFPNAYPDSMKWMAGRID